MLVQRNGFDKNTLLFEIFLFNLQKILMPNHKFLQESFLKEQVCPAEGLLAFQEMGGPHLFKKRSLMMDRSGR